MTIKVATYTSLASPGLQPHQLDSILQTSRRNNSRDALTGLLMFNGAAFTQTIEGPADTIDCVLWRLATDERHCEMEVRDERTVRQRIFPDWSMGYVRMRGGGVEGQHEVADAPARYLPRGIRELLMSMAGTLPFE